MNCPQCEQQIADYVAGRGNPLEMAQVEQHCKRCASCAHALQSELALRQRFASAPPLLETPDLWPRLVTLLPAPRKRHFWSPTWLTRPGLVATGAALVLGLYFLRAPVSPPTPSGGLRPESNGVPSPMLTMVYEMRQVGVAESETLLQETSPSRQVGLPLDAKGDDE